MTAYNPGDLVLVTFPLTSGLPGKSRPALVVFDEGDADVLLARVTTNTVGSPFDVAVTEWAKAGLLAASTVRLSKLVTAEKTTIKRTIGSLHSADRQSIGRVLNRLFAAW